MGGAAKKFAANALPVSRVTTQKAKEKRRLPTYCDARGHGHCEWDGVTPLKEHPKLKHVWICVGCYDFYHAMHFTVGKDGYYNQCRCCSDGGGTTSSCAAIRARKYFAKTALPIWVAKSTATTWGRWTRGGASRVTRKQWRRKDKGGVIGACVVV